jgi:hypothetical protein
MARAATIAPMGTTPCDAPLPLLPEEVPLPLLDELEEFVDAPAGRPMGWPETPVAFLQASPLRTWADAEKVMSAHYNRISYTLLRMSRGKKTYVEKRGAGSWGGDDLDGGVGAFNDVELRKGGRSDVGQADGTGASLVEDRDKRNIEAGDDVSDSEVDVAQGPFVRTVVDDGAAGQWPRRSVIAALFLANSSTFELLDNNLEMKGLWTLLTWELPLRDVVVRLGESERVSAPERIQQAEMGRSQGQESGENNGGAHFVDFCLFSCQGWVGVV